MTSQPSINDNPLGRELVVSMWTELAITTVVLAARLYVRLIVLSKPGWDDFWMFGGYFTTLAAFILNQLAVNDGFGMHTPELAPETGIAAVKWAFLGQVLGIMGCAFARMAFIATLVKLLAPTQRIQLWMLRAFFAAQVFINTLIALYILLQCHPIYGLWDHTSGATCLDPSIQEHIGFSQGAVNSFSDLALAIFPATIIWNLNMRMSVKLSLCLTMGLGIFAFATSILKTYSITEISGDPADLTYVLWGLQFWFCMENCALMVSATVPTLRPLLSRRKGANSQAYHSGPSDAYGTDGRRHNWTGASTLAGRFGPSDMLAPPRSETASDELELTGGLYKERGHLGTDTECTAGINQPPGHSIAIPYPAAPPEEGIIRTVDTRVHY